MAKTATASKTTMGKNVAPLRGGSVVTSAMEAAAKYAGKGISDRQEDNIVPLVYLLQSNSPQTQKGSDKYVKGATGGEQDQFSLGLGGVTKRFAEFTLDGGAHPVITTGYQDIRIPLVANGINRAAPAQLALL